MAELCIYICRASGIMKLALTRELNLINLRLFAFLALSLSLSFASLSSITYAASDYDDTWRSTSDLSLESPSCGSVDKGSEIISQLASDSGWPRGGYAWAPNDDVRDYYRAIAAGTTPGFISLVKTHQVGEDWTWISVYAQQGSSFYALWGDDSASGHYARIPGPSFDTTSYSGSWLGFKLDDSTCNMTFGTIGGTSVAHISNDGEGSVFSMENIYLHFYNGATFDQNLPYGYAGTSLGTYTDFDGDSLTSGQEFEQGTLDTTTDSDGDGINDMIESVWYLDRDDVFCKTSVSPHVCTYPDPTKQDVYVEVDWMDDGTTTYKPSSIQLGLVVDMFDDHNINLHFDTGEYGGGNELSVYDSPLLNTATTGEIDYFDYKSGGDGVGANFSADRNNVWHYMITGDTYTNEINPSASSGWATLMGSNIFIAIGVIRDNKFLASEDRAIANTIAHEIGHNLCLSSNRVYNEQPAACAYAGIDNKSGLAPINNPDNYFNLEDYQSVMNYRYQLTDKDDLGVVNYSDGGNVVDDHDDWLAIRDGLGKFNAPRTLYVEFGARGSHAYNFDPEGNVILE